MFEKIKSLPASFKALSRKNKIIIIAISVVVILTASVIGVTLHYLSKINHVAEDEEVQIDPSMEEFEVSEGDVPEENAVIIEFEGNLSDENKTEEENNSIADNISKLAEAVNAPVEPIKDENLINILLVGQDRRPGEGRGRSDSMMLVSINKSKKKASVVSFLRDTYVQIPEGYSNNRLNAAYAFGGFKLMKETFTANFGVHIDGCVEVDFTAFQKVIDIIGGVDIKLTEAEAKHIKVGETADTYHLEGDKALEYARIRKLDSDFGRTSRQRKVITAILNKARGMSVGTLNSLANQILPLCSTDMGNGQMMSLIKDLLPMVSSVSVKMNNVPGNGEYYSAYVNKMSVLVPNKGKIRDRLNNEVLPL